MCRTYFERLVHNNKVPSLDQLETMAARLFQTYSMTAAYWHAVHPGNDTMHNPFPLDDPHAEGGSDTPGSPKFAGDWVLANSILLMCNGLWFLEVCQAVTCGDIGQVWEVLKVSKIVNVLCKVAHQQFLNCRYGYLCLWVWATTIIQGTCWT